MRSDTVLAIGWEALAGSGFVSGVLFLAFVEYLRRTFATCQDLNGMGHRVNALHTLVLQTRDSVDQALDRVAGVEAEQRHQWEKVAEQVIKPLERITDKLETVSETQSAQRATLEHIDRWLDRTGKPRPPRSHP